RQAGHTVATVAGGSAFRRDGDYRYTIDPGSSADYRALIKALPAAPEKIVHLWNLPQAGDAWSALEGLDACQERGVYSLLSLAHGLGDHPLSRGAEVVAVSSQLHSVPGEESLCPAKATLLGPCRVIPFEYPQLTCRNVDVWPLSPDHSAE